MEELKEFYTNETKGNPYCWNKEGEYVRSGSYTDGYVRWLEGKFQKAEKTIKELEDILKQIA